MKAKDPQTGEWRYFVDKCLPFSTSVSMFLRHSKTPNRGKGQGEKSDHQLLG